MKLDIFKQTLTAFNEDKATRLASAIAFSTIFSLAPLFIVLIALVGFVIGLQNGGHGHHITENALLAQIEHSAGPDAANTIRSLVAGTLNKPRTNLIAQIIGWVTFAIGASALFSSIQDALNSIWNIEANRGGLKQMVRERVASFGMLAVIGFLLLVSLAGTVIVGALGSRLATILPVLAHPILLLIVGELSTGVIVMLVFAAMYKFLPDIAIAWNDVWIGAAATALLFVVGEAGVAFYLKFAGVSSTYGAAGSILVALLWIYYTALIFLLGAEFTKIRARDVKTAAPTKLRMLVDRPAGVDPRATNPAVA